MAATSWARIGGRSLAFGQKIQLSVGWHDVRVGGTAETVWIRLSTPADGDLRARQLIHRHLYVRGTDLDLRAPIRSRAPTDRHDDDGEDGEDGGDGGDGRE
jgi:hypothetical protein